MICIQQALTASLTAEISTRIPRVFYGQICALISMYNLSLGHANSFFLIQEYSSNELSRNEISQFGLSLIKLHSPFSLYSAP